MEKISNIIGKSLNQHNLGESARASVILHEANAFLHNKLRCTEDEVNAFRLKDGVLYVGTFGSVWSQEVFHQQEPLMNGIQKEFGRKAVMKVVIKSLTSSLN